MRTLALVGGGEAHQKAVREIYYGAAASQDTYAVPRPFVSPLIGCAAGAWMGVTGAACAVMDSALGRGWAGRSPELVLALCAGLLACACLVWGAVCPRMRMRVVAIAVGCVAGVAAGWVCITQNLEQAASVVRTPVGSCSFVVETDVRLSARGRWTFQATAHAPAGTKVRVWVDADGVGNVPSMGSVVALEGSWKTLDLGAEFDRSLAARGMPLRVRARSVEQRGFQGGLVGGVRQWRSDALALIGAERSASRALLSGVVCGAQAACARFSILDDFARLGLSHLVAVSGTHLAVVSALLGRLLQHTRMRPLLRLGLVGASLGVYVVFTGLQVSALRAWAMSIFALGAPVAGRRQNAISAVGAAASAMLLADPTCAASVGFRLSVLSVVGLTVFAPLAKGWLEALMPRRTPRWVVEGCALTLVSQVCTAPVALPLFGTMPFLAPPANILAAPLVTALLVGGLASIAVGLVLPSALPVLLLPWDLLAQVLCVGASWLASIPGVAPLVQVETAPVLCIVVLAALVVYAVWPVPSATVARALTAACVACVLAFAVRWGVCAPARIVVLDVGQGDAVLVQDGGRAVLVDTGVDEAVCAALSRNRVLRLDAVILTHTDLDHVGGLASLRGRIAVDRVLVARGVAASVREQNPELLEAIAGLRGASFEEIGAGDVMRVGQFDLTVAWPRQMVAGDANEDSLVVLVEGREAPFRALLTGDAEKEIVEPLVLDGTLGPVDMLKVGHHGSAASTSLLMAQRLAPTVAVASAGEGNRYGHPTQQCIDVLEEAGVLFLCTKDAGDVELRPDPNGVRVRRQVA